MVTACVEIPCGKSGKGADLTGISNKVGHDGTLGTTLAYLGQDLVLRNTGAGHRYLGFESWAVPFKPMACPWATCCAFARCLNLFIQKMGVKVLFLIHMS